MISYVKGNILHDQTDAIINTVNTVGVMGKGLACDNKELTTGQRLSIPTHSMNVPQNAPQAELMVNKTPKPRMTIGRAAVIGLINQYLSTGLHYNLSLLEVQKLVYFLTASGETLNKAQFQKHHYGPYADVLRHVLTKMEGHFISGYADGKNTPDVPILLKQDAITSAQLFLDSHPETKHHFDEVTKLVNGFESPYGMELLSTVHWVVTHECAGDEINPDDVVSKVHSWSERKAQMKPVHIKAALKRLCDEQWLNKVAPSL